jgi:thiol-disulfide isomerase/thioredoxin
MALMNFTFKHKSQRAFFRFLFFILAFVISSRTFLFADQNLTCNDILTQLNQNTPQIADLLRLDPVQRFNAIVAQTGLSPADWAGLSRAGELMMAASAQIKEWNSENLPSFKEDRPVVIFYTMKDCPYCILLKPVIAKLADEFKSVDIYHASSEKVFQANQVLTAPRLVIYTKTSQLHLFPAVPRTTAGLKQLIDFGISTAQTFSGFGGAVVFNNGMPRVIRVGSMDELLRTIHPRK